MPRDLSTTGLAGLLITSGVVHLVRPQVFESMVPAPLQGHRREVVYASGVAEILCGAGLLVPSTRRVAGLASAVLLLAVLPANIQMSVDHGRRAQRRRTTGARAAFVGTLARLPLQLPLVRAALRAARSAPRR